MSQDRVWRALIQVPIPITDIAPIAMPLLSMGVLGETLSAGHGLCVMHGASVCWPCTAELGNVHEENTAFCQGIMISSGSRRRSMIAFMWISGI